VEFLVIVILKIRGVRKDNAECGMMNAEGGEGS